MRHERKRRRAQAGDLGDGLLGGRFARAARHGDHTGLPEAQDVAGVLAQRLPCVGNVEDATPRSINRIEPSRLFRRKRLDTRGFEQQGRRAAHYGVVQVIVTVAMESAHRDEAIAGLCRT